MRTVHNWKRVNNHYDREYYIIYDGHKIKLDAGTNDEIYLFREGSMFFVLSLNKRLDYVGLVEIDSEDGFQPTDGNIFLQDEWNIKDAIGKKGLDLAPITIAKKLLEYLPY